MTVRENLELGAYQRNDAGGIAEDLERSYGLFPRLKERESQKAGTLSGGEQQMCAIGRALMARPRLLLLDEPSMGLAPILVDRIFEIIVEINKQGTTVLVVEQNASIALSVANRGYVLETGRDQADGQRRRAARRTTRCASSTSARLDSGGARGVCRRVAPGEQPLALCVVRRAGTRARRSTRRTRAARRARRATGTHGALSSSPARRQSALRRAEAGRRR